MREECVAKTKRALLFIASEEREMEQLSSLILKTRTCGRLSRGVVRAENEDTTTELRGTGDISLGAPEKTSVCLILRFSR